MLQGSGASSASTFVRPQQQVLPRNDGSSPAATGGVFLLPESW
jgi:hypothetical protein